MINIDTSPLRHFPEKKTKSQSEWPGAALESCSSLPFPSDAFGSWVQHSDQYSTEQCCSSSRSIPFQGVGEQNKLETMEHIHFISRSLSCPAPFIAHKGNSQFTAPWCCIPWWSASSPGSVRMLTSMFHVAGGWMIQNRENCSCLLRIRHE